LAALALGVAWAARAPAAETGPDAGDARSLVRRVLDAAPDESFVSQMRLTTPGGLVRAFTTMGKPLSKDLDARYIEVTDPHNLRDVRYLFYERKVGQDEQFVYIPAMKRVIRLTEKTRREPFLGSTFYVVDMVQPALDDFTYSFVGDDTVGGRACRLVQSVPKNPEKELYGKSVFAIDPHDLVVMRVRLYDRKGELFKLLTVEKIEKIDGYWTPMMQRMENVQDHTVSELRTLKVEYGEKLPDDFFHLSYLGR
jgi:hypothetical protein